MIRTYIIPILMVLLLTTCEEDRPRTNPLDPDTELDPSEWAPSNLQAEVMNDSEMKLTWEQEETRISGFRIDRKTGSGSFSQIAEVEKAVREYTDAGLTVGTNYTYRVKAFTDDNESDFATSNTTNTSFPSPSNLTATVIGDSEIQLTWSDNNSFEAGYKLERSEDAVTFTQIAVLGANSTTYTDTGLNYGTDYTYRVKAFTDDNESGYATSNTTTMSISSPTNLTATAIDDQSLQLTWTDNCSFESGYRLERSDGGSFTQIAELEANVTEYTDTGLNYGTDYTYRVKAFTDDNESDYATSNTTNTSFPAPTNLTATPLNESEILLNWSDNCSFEIGYRVERSSGGSFTQIAEIEANVTEYTDTGLNYGTDYTYTYRFKAFTDANESDYAETTVNFWQDCEGEWGGSAVEDCAGECNGTAVEDCNGDCDGTAFENECDICVGGFTLLHENYCGTITDIDENEYETVIIGNQIWMAENLNVTHYRNGDAIPSGHSNSEWEYLYDTQTGAYSVYNGSESYADTYGLLYNWYAATDNRNIAPLGWHIPTDDEIKQLEMHLGMSQSQADSMYYRGTNEGSKLAGNENLWYDGDLKENPEFGTSGFNALPGGIRVNSGQYDGLYFSFSFWSVSEYSEWYSFNRKLWNQNSGIGRELIAKNAGLSIRLVKD